MPFLPFTKIMVSSAEYDAYLAPAIEAERRYQPPAPAISVIVSSCGRGTLENTVKSIIGQLHPLDELIVIGPRHPIVPGGFRYIYYDNGGCDLYGVSANSMPNGMHAPDQRDCGGTENEIGQAVARNTHLMRCDDDDVLMPYALELVRELINRPDASSLEWWLFKSIYGCAQQWRSHFAAQENGRWVLPKKHDWMLPQHGFQQIVVPNINLLPRWRVFKEQRSDDICHSFIRRYVSATGVEPTYNSTPIGIIRPDLEQLRELGLDPMVAYSPQPNVGWNGVPT